MTQDPSDAETILSALDFDTNWLIEESNKNPLQFIGHEAWLYSIMNRIQFVVSRYDRVYNDNQMDSRLAALRDGLNREGPHHAE